MSGEHDDLFERLRAADPARAARAVGETGASPNGAPRAPAPAGPARDAEPCGDPAGDRLRLVAPGEHGAAPAGLRAVAAARRRYVRQRIGRMAAATTALACAASGAFAVGLPTGAGDGGDSGLRAIVPSLAEVAARAKAASRLRARSILWYRSDVEWGMPGLRMTGQQRTTLLRTDAQGRIIVMRSVNETPPEHQAEDLPETVDTVSVAGPEGGLRGAEMHTWSSATGRVRSLEGMMQPFVIYRTAGLLRAAERRAARRGGTLRVVDHEGRRAFSLRVDGVDEKPFPGEERFLLIDAETYAPLMFGIEQRPLARGPMGRPVGPYRYREQVREISELEDTPENQRLLELRGPLP